MISCTKSSLFLEKYQQRVKVINSTAMNSDVSITMMKYLENKMPTLQNDLKTLFSYLDMIFYSFSLSAKVNNYTLVLKNSMAGQRTFQVIFDAERVPFQCRRYLYIIRHKNLVYGASHKVLMSYDCNFFYHNLFSVIKKKQTNKTLTKEQTLNLPGKKNSRGASFIEGPHSTGQNQRGGPPSGLMISFAMSK